MSAGGPQLNRHLPAMITLSLDNSFLQVPNLTVHFADFSYSFSPDFSGVIPG